MVPFYYRFVRLGVTYRLSGTLDRLRKLHMVQHYKWIANGADANASGFGGKGCTRMRARLGSCPCPFWGTLSRAESLVSWHSSSFGRLCCITSIYSRVARFRVKPVTVDTLEVAQELQMPCDSQGLRCWPINIPDRELT
jgi:hypothetical protein